jgi:hypothetical protein
VHAYLVTPGFERALIDELGAAAGAKAIAPGVVVSDGAGPADPVFARQQLPGAALVTGTSVRALAEAAFAATEGAIDSAAGPFTLHAITPANIHPEVEPEPGLGARVGLVGRTLLELVTERRRRASRRYRAESPPLPAWDETWLLVQLLALARDRLLVSAAAPRPRPFAGTDLAPWPAGAAPVSVDRAPPSRAYQKLREAFAWMGAAPGPDQLCVDLGAAPGGWTATVLDLGARVVAVDRAPVAAALLRDARVAMVIGNAFTYAPTQPVDWMLSDVVCEPPRSVALVDDWLARGLCRNLVVTIKFKGRAGYGVLATLPPIFARHRPAFARVKQLAHNKNEVCVMVTGARVGDTT